jgi:hypothetical protein
VNLTLNTLAGGALGNCTTQQRLVDHDSYWLGITS